MDDLYSEQFDVARIQDLYVRFHWSILNLKSPILNSNFEWVFWAVILTNSVML